MLQHYAAAMLPLRYLPSGNKTSHSVMLNKSKIRYRWQPFNGFHMQTSFQFQSPPHSTKKFVLVPKE